MKKIYLLLCLATFFLGFGLSGQSTLKGSLLTDTGQPAEFVNVLLMSGADSTLVMMELSNEKGLFAFSNVDPGAYRLKISGLGYSDHWSEPFSLEKNESRVHPPIRLEVLAHNLATVEVTGRKPLLEQQAGKLIVNVDQSITGQGGSVTDLLKKVPGLIVVNEQIRMAGKQGVTILIDGRPTRYMDIQSLLREMPAENIAKIEVITQPGAAFDAEGTGGVINIVMKKNALLGTNGTVTLGAGYGELWKFRSGVSLSHRSGPWNLTAGAGYNHRTWVEGLELTRQIGDLTYDQKNYDPGLPHSFNGRFGVDYEISDQHKTGITLTASSSANNRVGRNQTKILNTLGEQLENWTTFNEQSRRWQNYAADAFYNWKIDSTGRELSSDLNYAQFRRRVQTDLRTEGADFETRQNQEPADTRIYAGRLDYKHPFNPEFRLETGLKISAARLDNELQADILTNGEWEVDPNLSNRFKFDEDIYAAYGTMAYKKGAWEANLGLRYEDAHSVGYSVTLDSTVDRHFRQLFPSFSLNTPLAGKLGLSFAYSYRIERPSYYDLNPFVSYLDPLTFEKGNIFLRPELTHSGQVSLTYDKQPFFNLSWDRTSDAITQVTEQDDATARAFATTVNLDRYDKYGGSLFFPLDFLSKSISGYGGVMLFYHEFKSDYLDAQFLQNQLSVTAFLNANIKLPKKINLEINGWFQGAGLDGIIAYQPLYGVDFGLEKKFLDDRLRVQLSAEGLIQKYWRGAVNYQNMDFDILSTWEAPVFHMRLTWSFGNQYLKTRENRSSSAEEERKRAQGKN